LILALTDPTSIPALIFFNNGGYLNPGEADTRAAREAVIGAPAASPTRALCRLTRWRPRVSWRPTWWSASLVRMSRCISAGFDQFGQIPSRFTAGCIKSMDNRRGAPGNQDTGLLSEDAFGHSGFGGSIGFADPRAGLSFGYAMSRQGPGTLLNPRGQSLVDAAYRSLGYGEGGRQLRAALSPVACRSARGRPADTAADRRGSRPSAPGPRRRCGRAAEPGSSSKLPIGMIAMPRSRSTLGSFEPQWRQKTCVNQRAPGTLKEARSASPRVKRTPSAGAIRLLACPAALPLRQRPQKQQRAVTGSASSTKATRPHRQLPRGRPGGSCGARVACTGASKPGGKAACWGSPSRISHQGAFEAAKMCIVGRTPGSPSRLPSGRKTRSPAPGPGTIEPQRGQNARWKPGDDS
jgi:hypothetical protein